MKIHVTMVVVASSDAHIGKLKLFVYENKFGHQPNCDNDCK